VGTGEWRAGSENYHIHRRVCTSLVLRYSNCIVELIALQCSIIWQKTVNYYPVEASDDAVSVTAWSRPTVLIRRPSSLGGYPVVATSAVRVFTAAQRAANSSSDCWRLNVRCCRSDALEQSATRHYCVSLTSFCQKLKTFLFSISFS